VRRAELLALGLCGLLSQRAHAHPAAAEPPIYGEDPCITVVDAHAAELWSIPYMVAYDDTLLEDGDIRLPDAKTHQFFALRGDVLMSPTGFELVPFESSGDSAPEQRVVLPLWINQSDVDRAAAAVEGSGTTFVATDVPSAAILDMQPALVERALRIDPDDARRPITSGSAERGITFAPAAWPPGLYTIAAYIFSPPFNGWAPKPGVVNIMSAEQHAPAAILWPVAAVVRSFQGRRVHACIDAPQGTTVRGTFRVHERPELGWQEWLAEEPLPNGTEVLERCFHTPDPQLTGSFRLRLELRAPDGSLIATHSPDTLTALSGTGICEPSEQVCCKPTEPTELEPPIPSGCAAVFAGGRSPVFSSAALAFLALLAARRRQASRSRT
jgi:hypothetical protein